MRKGSSDSPEIIDGILEKAEVLWLALVDDKGPHCVPINFAKIDGVIYIHSGKKGRKAAALNSGAPVAFSTAIDVRMRKGGDTACDQGYYFKSVMGNGTPRVAEGDEKMRGLDAIAGKYLDGKLPFEDKYLPVTIVYAIDIDTITARIKE